MGSYPVSCSGFVDIPNRFHELLELFSLRSAFLNISLSPGEGGKTCSPDELEQTKGPKHYKLMLNIFLCKL